MMMTSLTSSRRDLVSASEAAGGEVGVSWVEKVGGRQSGGSEGTRSSAGGASFQGGTVGVVERLVFIAVLEMDPSLFLGAIILYICNYN